MTGLQAESWVWGTWVLFCNRTMPRFTLRWQNQKLFSSSLSRCLRAVFICLCASSLVLLIWQLAVPWTAWPVPSFQWQQHQALAHTAALQRAQQQAHALAVQDRLLQLRTVTFAQHAQIDDLLLAWPNSAIRMSLLHRLQQMAQQRGLHVHQLKSTPEPEQHGYEASAIRFTVRGTEWATHAYWQAVNQLFQNGLWGSWMCRLLPDGQYALEGHLTLLWDAQDAFTDTGVAMLENASAPLRQHAASTSWGHVLPDQSHTQMRLVGSAEEAHSKKPATTWTWIRSGAQVHLVRPGQLLGQEHVMVRFADAQGLWLSAGDGLPDFRLGWEGGKP